MHLIRAYSCEESHRAQITSHGIFSLRNYRNARVFVRVSFTALSAKGRRVCECEGGTDPEKEVLYARAKSDDFSDITALPPKKCCLLYTSDAADE